MYSVVQLNQGGTISRHASGTVWHEDFAVAQGWYNTLLAQGYNPQVLRIQRCVMLDGSWTREWIDPKTGLPFTKGGLLAAATAKSTTAKPKSAEDEALAAALALLA